jgi:two-component system invasion response regulator UvrY
MDAADPTAVSVLIVDDQAPFRSAARAVVRLTPGFDVVGEAASGEEALTAAAELVPDLVLMDINMGGIDGIEATRRLLADHPTTVVVLVSTYQADDLPADARTSGAAAYVHKEELEPSTLVRLWGEHHRDGASA